MNGVQYKNNIYRNGEYSPNRSRQIAKEKARSIEPGLKQLKYRDDLYKFCIEKEIVSEGFSLYRTKQGIRANIRALISIIKKNGLTEEFFARNEKQPEEE